MMKLAVPGKTGRIFSPLWCFLASSGNSFNRVVCTNRGKNIPLRRVEFSGCPHSVLCV